MDTPTQLSCPSCGYTRPLPKYLTDGHVACPNCRTPLVHSRGADAHDLLELIECDLFTLSAKMADSLASPKAESIVREMAEGHSCEELIEALDWTQREQIEDATLLSLCGCCVSRVIESVMADGVVMDEEIALANQVCRPIADLFAAHFAVYAPFTGLALPTTREFFRTFQNDQRWFGGGADSEPDIVAGILCGAATVASGDQAIIDGFELLFETVAMRILAVDGITEEEEATFLRFKDQAKAIRELIDIHMSRASKSKKPDLKRQVEKSSSRVTFDIASQALAELNGLVGVAGVKKDVQRLMGYLTVQKARKKHKCRDAAQPLHFVFTGNPGTGKTTVAQLIGKILYGSKMLSSPKIAEYDGRKLLGRSPSETALKTDAAFRAASGGILFLEDLCSLASGAGSSAGSHSDEAVSALLARMEGDGDRTVVVLAGKKAPMAEFLTANPDLESRLTRSFHFDDYAVADMCRIFERFCIADDNSLTPNARAYVFLHFSLVHERRDENFANARVVRRSYEDAIVYRKQRLAARAGEPTPEQLKLIEGSDIISSSIHESELRSRDVSFSKWEAECPSCHRTSHSGVANLGRRVNCKCSASFVFPWWNLDRSSIPGLTAVAAQR